MVACPHFGSKEDFVTKIKFLETGFCLVFLFVSVLGGFQVCILVVALMGFGL